MAAVKRLLLLRRSIHSSSFLRHTIYSSPPPIPIPYYTNTSSFIRHFSSSNDHNHTNQDFDGFNSVLTQPDRLLNVSTLGTGVYDDSILPVRVLISLLDSYHNLTGLPWWVVIASSTLVMRLALFPLIVLQLRKLKTIGELFPKLPPIFPPPLSGRSIKGQLKLFFEKKQAVGCPSFLWFTAALFIQLPSFFLWITSVRRMSLEQHPGFDCGGTLWFQNLSEYPNGALGPIIPLTIALLHYVIVQISFQKSSLGQMPGVLATLAKYYKYYLEILTLPILFTTFNVPQGSLVYWLTNSSLSLVQQLTLKHPTVRIKLGLPNIEASRAATSNRELRVSETTENSNREVGVSGTTENSLMEGKEKLVSVKELSPLELVNGALIYLSKGNKDRALPLLRLAIQKDSEYGRALLVMGQILMNDGLTSEALEYFERIVSKLSLSGNPVIEDVNDFMVSCQLSGVAYAKQNNYEKAIARLQRVASLEEPEDPKSKAIYYDGLVLLSSALYNVGRKPEAAQYAHRAAAYDSKYNDLLEQIEKDKDEFVNDLVSSRRGDY